MKILCYTDPHFCERASIVNKMGTKYTVRIENQLKSINWVEQLAKEKGCQCIICAGDFFDKAHLTDQELTALKEIEWASDMTHYFLVGNHESEENDLHFNATKALEGKNRIVISEPTCLEESSVEIAFLPYISEVLKRPLKEYFKPMTSKPRILISHNDLLGVQMGPVVSKFGFSPAELEEYCTLCINGHLHNGQPITKRVLNLGNLTGKDFGENAEVYSHKVIYIDTDSLEVDFIENPYAFNFYKIDINSKADIHKLSKLKSNAVISVKCSLDIVESVRDIISKNPNIIESRVILVRNAINNDTSTAPQLDLVVDQCVKFAECCREKLENTDILEAELAIILN